MDPRSDLMRASWRGPVEQAALAVIAATAILLAMPPHDLWPLALIGTAALYQAMIAPRRRVAVATTYLAGLLINLVGNGWALDVMHRFAHAGDRTAWLVLIGTAAYQAAVFALAAAATSTLVRRGVAPLVAAPLAMALAEAVIPFVFPWYLGMTVVPAWPLTQVAELGGPPAVTALIMLIGGVLAEVLRAVAAGQRPGRAVAWAAAIAGAVIALGGARAWHVAHLRAQAPRMRVAVIQPNVGLVSIERREREGDALLAMLRATTEEAGDRGAELVVWPESAFPFLFDRNQTQAYPPGHPWELRGRYRGRLLFGALSHEFGQAHVFNSAVLISRDGRVAGRYDKVRLVVFGEYIPMRDRFPAWAARLRARTPDWPDIQPGVGPRTLVDADLRIGPLICYEDILPDQVAALARRADPNLLVTVANHAWFGDSAAPHQALALATLRAIETRRDLVRSANTGVSSIGDALGRVTQRTTLHAVDPTHPPPPAMLIADVRLLDAFALGPYAVPAFPWVCAAALVAAALLARRARRGATPPRSPRARR